MNATPRQVELFHKLTTDREFPPETDIEKLRSDFAELDTRSASAWIDKAMTLPRPPADGDDRAFVPPAF